MKKIIIILMLISMLGISGCTIYLDSSEEVVNESGYEKKYSIETKEEIDEVKLKCVLGIGELNINGGSEKIVDSIFNYSHMSWEPIIEDSDIGSVKIVKISNPSVNINSLSNYVYDWNINLNKKLPLSIDLDLGVGEGNINLSDTNLRNLDIQMGVGDVTVDLRKIYDEDVVINIDGGVGKLKLLLSKDMGMKANISGGLKTVSGKNLIIKDNNYYNKAFEVAEKIVELNIRAGIGQIELIIED